MFITARRNIINMNILRILLPLRVLHTHCIIRLIVRLIITKRAPSPGFVKPESEGSARRVCIVRTRRNLIRP